MKINEFFEKLGISLRNIEKKENNYYIKKERGYVLCQARESYAGEVFYNSCSRWYFEFTFTNSPSNCGLVYVDHINNIASNNFVIETTLLTNKIIYSSFHNLDKKVQCEISNMLTLHALLTVYRKQNKSENLLFVHTAYSNNHPFETLCDSFYISPMNQNSKNKQIHGIIDIKRIIQMQVSKEAEDWLNSLT